jgi:hypothetical protein
MNTNVQRPTSNVQRPNRERPILFSGEMVRAILEGRKTQTRRILKPQPFWCPCLPSADILGIWTTDRIWHEKKWIPSLKPGTFTWDEGCHPPGGFWKLCPYGNVGDWLWVREAWMPFGSSPGRVAIGYKASNDIRPDGVTFEEFGSGKWFNASEETYYKFKRDIERMEAIGDKWRPSIHMPRWASRLTLEITDVRVQRLQEISEEDAWAEGCRQGEPTANGGYFPAEEPDPSGIGERGWDCATDWYADLWEEINGEGSWDKNPWVWVVTFKRIEKPNS